MTWLSNKQTNISDTLGKNINIKTNFLFLRSIFKNKIDFYFYYRKDKLEDCALINKSNIVVLNSKKLFDDLSASDKIKDIQMLKEKDMDTSLTEEKKKEEEEEKKQKQKQKKKKTEKKQKKQHKKKKAKSKSKSKNKSKAIRANNNKKKDKNKKDKKSKSKSKSKKAKKQKKQKKDKKQKKHIQNKKNKNKNKNKNVAKIKTKQEEKPNNKTKSKVVILYPKFSINNINDKAKAKAKAKFFQQNNIKSKSKKQAMLIYFCGKNFKQCGVDNVLNTFNGINEALDVKLVISSDDKEQLKYAKELAGNNENIIFTNKNCFLASDIFLLPTNNKNFAYNVLMAISNKCCVFLPKSNDASSILDEFGLMANANDTGVLHKIEALALDGSKLMSAKNNHFKIANKLLATNIKTINYLKYILSVK